MSILTLPLLTKKPSVSNAQLNSPGPSLTLPSIITPALKHCETSEKRTTKASFWREDCRFCNCTKREMILRPFWTNSGINFIKRCGTRWRKIGKEKHYTWKGWWRKYTRTRNKQNSTVFNTKGTSNRPTPIFTTTKSMTTKSPKSDWNSSKKVWPLLSKKILNARSKGKKKSANTNVLKGAMFKNTCRAKSRPLSTMIVRRAWKYRG